VQAALFQDRYFGWLLPDEDSLRRPTLFFLDFTDEKSMYFLCIATLVVALILVSNLRRSRFGRLLIATRENEPNVQSFGVNTVRLKLMAFAVSGAMAGFAGAVFVHQQQALDRSAYGADVSLQFFILAVLGGISSPAGALLGSAYGNLVQYFLQNNVVVQVFLSFGGPLFLVYIVPGGLISVITKLRDSALRIIAQRRQLVVPSLFADYDPEALEARLIQLSEASDDSGLAALPTEERYALESELYRGEGERIVEKLAGPRESKETAALTAASESVQENR
jgi:branched-chain amino acid transport system permease protein